MPKRKEGVGVVQQLKDAIEGSGLGINELSRLSGVAASQLSHFVRGERTLTLPAAEKLCEALGYRLVKTESGVEMRSPSTSKHGRPKKKPASKPKDNPS